MKRALAVAACVACSTAEAPVASGPPPTRCTEQAVMGTRCGQLVDGSGRVVIYRGINARVRGQFDADLGAGKVPLMPPIPELTDDDLKQMRRIGFDLLRLPINWSAIEPEQGKYDDAYLERTAAVVARCKAHDLKVLVDLHQDAYSKYIGQDGAPLWAIVPAPTELLEGPLDDLGDRRISKQVLGAFQTFFSRSSPDGARLRARFGEMAARVAAKLKGDDTVLALELFNEPQGTDEELRAFHDEVTAAVRKADPARLIAFEPSATRNFTDRSTIPTTPLAHPGTIYAPHVYTKVFAMGCDDKCRDDFTIDTLRTSNENARAEAEGWRAPLLIGELGFDPRSPRFGDWVAFQLELQDDVMASSAWWVWKENSEGSWGFYDWNAATDSWTERTQVRKAFARVQPRAIAGWPQRWRWDREKRRFELVVLGDPTIAAPTVVHTPFPGDGPASFKVTCDGKPIPATPDARGDLAIPCNGEGIHTIVVEPA